MLTEERQHAILRYLEEKKAITVTELTKLLDTSESTIRRDLTVLDRQKKLKKVHGGATRLEKEFLTTEYDVMTKTTFSQEEKEKIACYAASLIQENDVIFLDAGTTTEKMIDYIQEKGAIFVTNGIVHARKLVQKGMKTTILGGEVKRITEAIVGTEAVANLQKYNFTKCFIGVNGISQDGGFSTPTPDEAYVKKEAIRHSFASFVLADHTKFFKTTAITFAQLDEAVIITDKKPDSKYLENATIREAER